MSFKEFVHEYNLIKKAKSIIKIQQTFPSFYLKHVGIYLRDDSFETDVGIVSLHPSKRTHWEQ